MRKTSSPCSSRPSGYKTLLATGGKLGRMRRPAVPTSDRRIGSVLAAWPFPSSSLAVHRPSSGRAHRSPSPSPASGRHRARRRAIGSPLASPNRRRRARRRRRHATADRRSPTPLPIAVDPASRRRAGRPAIESHSLLGAGHHARRGRTDRPWSTTRPSIRIRSLTLGGKAPGSTSRHRHRCARANPRRPGPLALLRRRGLLTRVDPPLPAIRRRRDSSRPSGRAAPSSAPRIAQPRAGALSATTRSGSPPLSHRTTRSNVDVPVLIQGSELFRTPTGTTRVHVDERRRAAHRARLS